MERCEGKMRKPKKYSTMTSPLETLPAEARRKLEVGGEPVSLISVSGAESSALHGRNPHDKEVPISVEKAQIRGEFWGR